MDNAGHSWERELNYYRRECNDLGARLLRLQEEQSQAFREARRSRTVVKLLRETYRLADFASTTHDVGGAMLELVVDNTMCDRAALLREEVADSGQFVVLHAIGLPEAAMAQTIWVPHPPAFLYTSDTAPGRGAEPIVAALEVPYVLWAYDRGSRHAIVIGNHFESNVSRPFEPGDQELIESALSIYLDVLYRKHAEAQLLQAKQAAEAARDARMLFLAGLAEDLRAPIRALIDLCEQQAEPGCFGGGTATLATQATTVVGLARTIRDLVETATVREAEATPPPVLNPEWMTVDELVYGAVRTAYAASIKSAIEIECRMPKRPSAVLVDRARMGRVVEQLVSAAVRATPTGGTVRVSAGRRSDGGLEIFFCSRGEGPLAVAHAMPEKSLDGASWSEGASLDIARTIVEAHGGSLTVDSSAFTGTNVRMILPDRVTRDAAIFGGNPD